MAKQTKKELTPITTADFYSISTAEDPRVHPDGNLIAYVHITPQREGKSYMRSIWIIDKHKKTPRQFTAGGKDGDSCPRWSPDGKQLAFISNRSGKPQIHLIPIDGGESKPFTSMQNGVFSPIWSPDGKYIAFACRTREEERKEEDKQKQKKFIDERTAKRMEEDRKHEEELLIDPREYTRTLIRLGTIYKDDRTTHVYIQKVSGGKPVRLTDGDYDFFAFEWTPDGKFLVATTKQKGDVDIEIQSDLVKIPVKKGKPVFITTDKNADYSAQVSPDGKWVYYLSFQAKNLARQRMLLQRVPVNGGKIQVLTESFDYDPHFFQLSPDGGKIYFLISQNGRDQIFSIPKDGGDPKSVICGDFMVGLFHLSKNTMAYQAEAPDIPGDIFYSDLDGKNQKRVTNLNRKVLAKKKLSMPEEVWIDRSDGFRIHGWIMRPHNYKKGKKYPWVIQVHGGPHIMWGYSWWHEFQSMCAKGYGVYFSNPRGSDGYGGNFKQAIHLKWGHEDYKDILAGADLMVKKKLADPDKLYLTGGSFGGFMTAWIVTHDHRFKAAASQRGVYNFISMYGVSDANTLIEWEFDTFPWKDPELLWDHSPLKYVENAKTPLMIIHADQDYRVGISQADEMYVALRRLGKEAKIVRYPREGHELSRAGEPKHRVDRINRIIKWFDEHR